MVSLDHKTITQARGLAIQLSLFAYLVFQVLNGQRRLYTQEGGTRLTYVSRICESLRVRTSVPIYPSATPHIFLG